MRLYASSEAFEAVDNSDLIESYGLGSEWFYDGLKQLSKVEPTRVKDEMQNMLDTINHVIFLIRNSPGAELSLRSLEDKRQCLIALMHLCTFCYFHFMEQSGFDFLAF